VTADANDAAALRGDGSIDLPPTVARRLLEAFDRDGIDAGAWIAVMDLHRSLLRRAARDGDICEFERQFRLLAAVRAKCRREGWGGGGERRARWRLVRSDLRDGCVVLGASGQWPSARFLRAALRTALADRPASDCVPALLAGATQQVIVAGDAAGARRVLRILERDLCDAESVLGAAPGHATRCIECSEALGARFGIDLRRTGLVRALCCGWLLHESSACALEAVDPLLVPCLGASRSERDAHAMALAIAAHAWHLLGDGHESERLTSMARAAIGRGFLARWSSRSACAVPIARLVSRRG
jgi:hypothetical protein